MSRGYLYILRSEKSGRYYVGSAVDPDRRLREHNTGHVRATCGRGPWQRIALLCFSDSATARKAESYLKSLKSRTMIEKVVDGSFVWPSHVSQP